MTDTEAAKAEGFGGSAWGAWGWIKQHQIAIVDTALAGQAQPNRRREL